MLDVTKPCPYCARKMDRSWGNANVNPRWPSLDHKIPSSRGGLYSVPNLVWACVECNNEKGSMTVEEYMEFRRVVEGVIGRRMRRLTWERHCITVYGIDNSDAVSSSEMAASDNG